MEPQRHSPVQAEKHPVTKTSSVKPSRKRSASIREGDARALDV